MQTLLKGLPQNKTASTGNAVANVQRMTDHLLGRAKAADAKRQPDSDNSDDEADAKGNAKPAAATAAAAAGAGDDSGAGGFNRVPNHYHVRRTAKLMALQGRYPEAEKLYVGALDEYDKHKTEFAKRTAAAAAAGSIPWEQVVVNQMYTPLFASDTRNELACLLSERGRHAEAAGHLVKAIELAKSMIAPAAATAAATATAAPAAASTNASAAAASPSAAPAAAAAAEAPKKVPFDMPTSSDEPLPTPAAPAAAATATTANAAATAQTAAGAAPAAASSSTAEPTAAAASASADAKATGPNAVPLPSPSAVSSPLARLCVYEQNLIAVLSDLGQHTATWPLYVHLIDVYEHDSALRSPKLLADQLYGLADTLKKQRRFVSAEPLARRAMEIRKVEFKGKGKEYALSLALLAVVLGAPPVAQYAEAEKCALDAISACKAEESTFTSGVKDKADEVARFEQVLMHVRIAKKQAKKPKHAAHARADALISAEPSDIVTPGAAASGSGSSATDMARRVTANAASVAHDGTSIPAMLNVVAAAGLTAPAAPGTATANSAVVPAGPVVAAETKATAPSACGRASAGCDKPGKARCARCQTVRYCSVACQKADWPTHKLACGKAS